MVRGIISKPGTSLAAYPRQHNFEVRPRTPVSSDEILRILDRVKAEMATAPEGVDIEVVRDRVFLGRHREDLSAGNELGPCHMNYDQDSSRPVRPSLEPMPERR